MNPQTHSPGRPAGAQGAPGTAMGILVALSFSHLANDTLQSVLPAIYPLLKAAYQLNFAQVGLITFTFQCCASLLQPVVGLYTDRHPLPYSLPVGMGITLAGLAALAFATDFPMVVAAAGLVGVGSAVFHPEASRVARCASGGRHGFAQSLFQVGGNLGSSLGPVLAAVVIGARGQRHILWLLPIAVAGIVLLSRVGSWYRGHVAQVRSRGPVAAPPRRAGLTRGRVVFSIAILLALIFSKFFYLVSLTSYYTFYLITKFHVSVGTAQICLFVFLFSVALGTIVGGPVGDRIGRKYVIWASILGVAPFTLLLPYANLPWTIGLTVPIGFILSSAMPAILVYAQEMLPGRTGLVAGLFFGFAFGMAGVGSAVLGRLADHTSVAHVYAVCAYLPLIGLLTALLPRLE